MKYFQSLLIVPLVVMFFAVPLFTLHAAGNGVLPPCNQPVNGSTIDPTTGKFAANNGVECGWADLAKLADNILNFLILLAIPCAAVAFAWAGYLTLSASGDEGKVKQAKDIFTKVAIGLFYVCAAWLIVHFILIALVGTTDYNVIQNPS